jgi:hypothetical protein
MSRGNKEGFDVSLVFTSPGKIGDCLHQWPVAFHYCQQNETRCTLWLDEKTLKPLVELFEAQPCVEKVELKPGIENYQMGGQPWDFGLQMSDHMDHEIYHLGMRKFPERQITLDTLHNVPLNIEAGDISSSKSLVSGLPESQHKSASRVLLHSNYVTHMGSVPGFWRFVASIAPYLQSRFQEITFIGTPTERARALEIYPHWTGFDDGGSFLKLARYIDESQLVIGCGSSNVVLAGLLKVPAVRVHDPIGEHPKIIWSNLGENQLNATEFELRTQWPEFRDQWLAAEPAASG